MAKSGLLVFVSSRNFQIFEQCVWSALFYEQVFRQSEGVFIDEMLHFFLGEGDFLMLDLSFLTQFNRSLLFHRQFFFLA